MCLFWRTALSQTNRILLFPFSVYTVYIYMYVYGICIYIYILYICVYCIYIQNGQTTNFRLYYEPTVHGSIYSYTYSIYMLPDQMEAETQAIFLNPCTVIGFWRGKKLQSLHPNVHVIFGYTHTRTCTCTPACSFTYTCTCTYINAPSRAPGDKLKF
jgi:hypothetical protein